MGMNTDMDGGFGIRDSIGLGIGLGEFVGRAKK